MSSDREPSTTREFIDALLSPNRLAAADPLVIFSFCPINIHETVADIGCGPGFFTVPLAKSLINGKLYALDIDEEMVAACQQRVLDARMGNVEVLQCGEYDFPVEPESLDGAFVAFVVHHSPDRPRFLSAVRDLVLPKGWCVVLEWYKKETESGPPLGHRLDPEELVQLARGAGFRSLGWRDLNGEQYMVTFRRS